MTDCVCEGKRAPYVCSVGCIYLLSFIVVSLFISCLSQNNFTPRPSPSLPLHSYCTYSLFGLHSTSVGYQQSCFWRGSSKRDSNILNTVTGQWMSNGDGQHWWRRPKRTILKRFLSNPSFSALSFLFCLAVFPLSLFNISLPQRCQCAAVMAIKTLWFSITFYRVGALEAYLQNELMRHQWGVRSAL